jgi:RNA recognition motif-containing protein
MNVYVGNLSDQISQDDLRQLFEQYGRVTSIEIIEDKFSDRPLGFGFVEMPGQNQARNAIEGLNRTMVKDRVVIVAETAGRIERRKSVPVAEAT